MNFTRTTSGQRFLRGVLVLGLAAVGLVNLLGQLQARPTGYTFTVNYDGDTVDNIIGNGFCEDFFGRCSLRAAVQETNALAGQDTIIIPAGTYLLAASGKGEELGATGDLDITGDLIINGAGAGAAVIDGAGVDRVFHVAGASTNVHISGVTIKGGIAPDAADGTLRDGGGIYNSGILTLQNSSVTGNQAGAGGFTGGSHVGGGSGGGVYSLGSLTLNNTNVSNNSSGAGASGTAPTQSGNGGGIYAAGSLSLVNSTVYLNATGPGGSGTGGASGRASGAGGGIYAASSNTISVTYSLISSNSTGSGGSGDNLGGGAGSGAGIYFQGNAMSISGSLIQNNAAGSGGAGSNGSGGGGSCAGAAAAYTRDNITIDQTTIRGNTAGGGSQGGHGGGFCYLEPVQGNLQITGSHIVQNDSGSAVDSTKDGGYGAGLYLSYATAAIAGTEIAGNTTGAGGAGAGYPAGGHGGGIYATNVILTVDKSTISGNSTGTGKYGGSGGGISQISGALTVNSSTVSGNQAAAGASVAGEGGGIYAAGTTVINDSTITLNTAAGQGGGIRQISSTSLKNSLIAQNTAVVYGPDCSGSLISLSHNLLGSASGCTLSGDATGNLIGQSPRLGPLQDNGGSAPTHALLPGSPAVDTGAGCFTVDQRHQPRPGGSLACDIGAFEVQGVETTTSTSLPEGKAVTFGATMVTITRTAFTTDPMTTTVTRKDSPPGGGTVDAGEMPVTWSITATVDLGLDLDVSFCYSDSELGALVEADLTAYRYDGASWADQGGSVDPAGNCVRLANVSAFSDWTLATYTPTMPAILVGSVSGVVRYTGSNPDALTIAVGLHASVGDPPLAGQVISVPGGPYTFSSVNNGTYYVSALVDLDASGGAPDSYDLLSWYDANHDGAADPVTIDANDLTGIDILVTDQYLEPRSSWMASVSDSAVVSSAGDVNGDGYDDILVGIPDSETVYLWLGGQGGLGTDGTLANADWLAHSNQNDSEFGKSVAGAGDINKDGYDDIIIGAPSYDNGQSAEGAVFVYFGAANGLGVNGTETNADWTAESNQASANLGESVSTAGDVNGDGYADIIIGAPGYDDGQSNEGLALLYYGSSSGLGADGTPANADWMLQSGQAGAKLGQSVTSAGNVDNDLYGDVMVGAPFYDNGNIDEGLVLLFLGSGSGLGTSATPSDADWQAESNSDWRKWGEDIAAVGDVNGDSFDDIVISGPPLYAWYGSASGLGASGVPGNSDWLMDSWSFKQISAAGDTNADGFDDLWIGQPTVSYPVFQSGSVGLVNGSSSGLGSDYVWWLAGTEADGALGYSVSPAGDVNGDGADDVLAVQLHPERVFMWMGGMGLAEVSANNSGPTVLGNTTTLTAAASIGTVSQLSWQLGDGQTGAGTPVNHTYGSLGSYTAVVTISNPVSWLTATTTVSIYEEPIAGLAASVSGSLLPGKPVTFTASITAGSSVAFAWDFGDSSFGAGDESTHIYEGIGEYTVTVTATNSVNTKTKTVTVTITDSPESRMFLPAVLRPQE